MAQKELHVDEIKLQLAEKEQDLSELEAACNGIVLDAEKNDHIQAEIEANLKQAASITDGESRSTVEKSSSTGAKAINIAV